MIFRAALIDLRVRLRSAATAAAVIVLTIALTGAVALCFRALGQQPAPTVDYGATSFGRSGFNFGTPPRAETQSGPAALSSLSTLTSSSRGDIVLVVLAGVLSVTGGVIGAMVGAGTIAGEYERETLDLAVTSQLGARGLVLTKLLTTFVYCLLLALVMLPAFSFTLVFSDVPLSSIAVASAVVLGSLLCGSAIGVFLSAALRSTAAAFLTAVALSVLLFVGGGAVYLLIGQTSLDPPTLAQLLLIPSPIAALLSSATGQLEASTALLLPPLLHASPQHPVHLFGPWQLPLPLWSMTLAIDLLATVALTLGSARLVRRSLAL